jgi:type I restriction enzyme S subunit
LSKTKNTITEEGLKNSSAWIVPENSLLLSIYATIGETAINTIPLATNQAILAIIPKGIFDKVFGAYLLKFNAERLKMQNIQSTQKNVNKGIVERFKIPLPPLSEQKKIAYVLSSVQEAKEKTEDVIKATKELKKSMMKYLFTYGPVSLEEAEKVPLKETEIGLIPEEWKVVRLGDIANFKNGINFSANQKGNRGILTIDVLNMYGEGIYVNLNNLYRVNKKIDENYLLREDDILFVRSSLKREGVGWSSLFKPTNEPVTFCGFIIRARLKVENVFPEYLTNYLRTKIARNNLIASSGKVAITNINQGMLGKIIVPCSPLQTQKKIASILLAIDRKIEAEENKKKALEDLFKSLLYNLMTAKIRVNNLEKILD